MTNIEIIFKQALDLFNSGKITGKSRVFIDQIKNYDKRRLTKLTSSQYKKLRDIVQDFSEATN